MVVCTATKAILSTILSDLPPGLLQPRDHAEILGGFFKPRGHPRR